MQKSVFFFCFLLIKPKLVDQSWWSKKINYSKWNYEQNEMLIQTIRWLVTEKKQRKKSAFFQKFISDIFKDIAHISGEPIVIHMYSMCAKTRSCAIISFSAITIWSFSSLFLSEAVCSTGDPISIFKNDAESSNVVLQNVYLGFLIKYCFIPENSCQS